MTPRIFGIPLSISPKPVKLASSKLVHSFILAVFARLKCSKSDRGRGLCHVTVIIFGIPSSIFREHVKLESSKLVHRFILAGPTRLKYNISERGPGLGHVTS